LGELKTEAVDEKIRRCKSNWLWHATRMGSNKMGGMMLNYTPNGRRRIAGPL